MIMKESRCSLDGSCSGFCDSLQLARVAKLAQEAGEGILPDGQAGKAGFIQRCFAQLNVMQLLGSIAMTGGWHGVHVGLAARGQQDGLPEFRRGAAVTKYNTSMLTSSNRFVLYTVYNGEAYAIDGSGNAVLVYIDDKGKIRTDVDNPDNLLWTFSRYNNSTAIQNVGSGRYLRPYYNSNSDNGITTPSKGATTVSASGEGATFSQSNTYITFDAANSRFVMTRTQSQNVTFLIGQSTPCTVWLDGTNG